MSEALQYWTYFVRNSKIFRCTQKPRKLLDFLHPNRPSSAPVHFQQHFPPYTYGNNIVSTNLEPNVYVRSNVVNRKEMEGELKGLVIALHPKLCFRSGVPEPLFLVYEDDVVCSVIVDKFVGAFVGEFVGEDVEIGSQEFRRRLRFRRMPNL
nr:methyltransferase-like protein 13 [Tanacetum cinerariifolium]